MNKVINYLKVLVIPITVTFILPLLLSILNIIGLKTYNLTLLISMIIIGIISGYYIGKSAEKKGYINGLIFGIVLCTIFFIYSLLFRNSYTISTLIYYIVIIISCTFGSMIGIQKKDSN